MHTGFWPGHCGWEARRELHEPERCEEIIELMGWNRIAFLGDRLPYGVRKRVELARAMAMEPRLLLLDEPMAGMNLEETEDMARYIREINEEWHVPIVLVEHDMQMVMDLAHRVMAMDFGRVLAWALRVVRRRRRGARTLAGGVVTAGVAARPMASRRCRPCSASGRGIIGDLALRHRTLAGGGTRGGSTTTGRGRRDWGCARSAWRPATGWRS
jgi:energy-coupling factor transporter ATP-binding protein EcfA2